MKMTVKTRGCFALKAFCMVWMVFWMGPGFASAQEKGIRFEKGDYASVLAKAKAEKKLVFIDAFTTWCGPCKWMEQHAFPNEGVGKFFNASFVNAKMDMEKGEGVELKLRYGVHAFPTYLFVDGDGELVHRFVGSMELEDFVKNARKALQPEQQYYTLARRFEAGDREADFLYKLAFAARSAGEDSASRSFAESYLKTQDSWLVPKNLKLIADFCTSAKVGYFTFMKAHPSEFKAMLGGEAYEKKLYDLAYRDADEATGLNAGVKKGEEKGVLNKAKVYFKQVLPDQQGKLNSAYAIKVYGVSKDLEGYGRSVIGYYRAFPSYNAEELNGIAWNFYEVMDKPVYLKEALAWALRSVELSKGYGNMDTVANLYAKLGNLQAAKAYAEKAVAFGKATGEDVSTTEKLLKSLP